MIRQSDILWWVQEVRKDSASAPKIVEALAERLVELDAQNESLRNELIRLRASVSETAPAADTDALQRRVETLQTLLDQQLSTETSVILISDRGQAIRMPLSQVRLRLRDEQPALHRAAVLSLRSFLLAHPQDEVLILTSQGRAARLLLPEIPFAQEGNWPDEPQIALEAGEHVAVAAALDETPRFWTVITRRGTVRQFLHARLQRLLEEESPVVRPAARGDEPVAIVSGDRGDLLLITRWGKAVRFPQRAIDMQGAQALDLDQDDAVVGGVPLADDVEVIVVTASGALLRRDTTGFSRQTKPGGAGKSFIQAFDVLGIYPSAARGRLLFLTYAGTFAAVAPSQAPVQTRLARGTQIIDLAGNPAIATLFVPGGLLG
jgi:DNA gyrase/topoisomerase IV subunit A